MCFSLSLYLSLSLALFLYIYKYIYIYTVYIYKYVLCTLRYVHHIYTYSVHYVAKTVAIDCYGLMAHTVGLENEDNVFGVRSDRDTFLSTHKHVHIA